MTRGVVFMGLFLICINITTDSAHTEVKCRERNRPFSIKRDEFKIVDVQYGEKILLACHYCNEEDDELPKIWYKMNNPQNKNVTEVELGMATNLTSNRVFVTPDHTLVIQNISQKDEGIYFCHGQEGIGKELKYNYLINTILSSRHLPTVGNLTQWVNYKVQWLQPANNMLHSSMAFRLPELLSKKIHFDVFTEWEEWGPCVSCHKQPAERRRIGKCRLRASQPEINGKDLLDLPPHIKLFLAISELSCRSYLVRQIGQEVLGFALWMIPDFIQTEECKGECTQKTENIPVYYIKHRKIPPKIFLKFPMATHRSVSCPGATPLSIVSWEKGKDTLRLDLPETPLLVDAFGTLLFENPTAHASGNYSCYINGIKIQEIWISFYTSKEFISQKTQRYFIYLAFLLFLSGICYCGCVIKACFQRKHFPDVEEAEALVPYKVQWVSRARE